MKAVEKMAILELKVRIMVKLLETVKRAFYGLNY